MKIYISIVTLILFMCSHHNITTANDWDSIPGRNFGYKNAIGPIYAFNAVGHNIGVQYERLLDKKNVLAVKGGIYYGWYDYGYFYNNRAKSTVLQTGIKVYPGVMGKRVQFASGLDINYATGHIYLDSDNDNVHRKGLSLLFHGDMMLNMDKNVYFFFSLGHGVFFTSVKQKVFLASMTDYAFLNMQLSAGWRFRF